jgi:RHS repeat-associated protein
VDVTDSKGGTWPDRDWFAGMPRENITFNGPGGAEVSGQISDPWASSATATRTITGTTVHARFTNTATVRSRVVLDGGRGDRTTRVTTSFDSLGMPTEIDDFGEVGVSGDEQCVKNTYTPRNTGAWLMDRVHRTRSFAVGCAATGSPASLDEDDVIADVRTSFDGHGYGVAPTRGLSTRGEEMAEWNAGTPSYVTVSQVTYDAHGRAVEARDALDRPTNTAYTPSAGGPVTGTTSTNALGHETTTTLDPAFGNKTRIVDPNGKVTDLTYDPLGRLAAVWLPGRDMATQTANLTFAYGIRDDNVSYVTSRRLNPLGNYVTSHSLFDGLLREVQNQAPSPAGGRLLTNTFYDNAGRAFQAYGSYYTTGSPSTSLHVPIEPFDVPTQAQTLFDGAGRVTAEVFRPFHEERWRTSYRYRGDRTDVAPPAGGTATSTATDAQGRTIELRQYEAPTPTGSYDATTYDYDRKGQLAGVTDPAGNQWSYVYDLRGRQTELHDPDAGWTRLQYDDANQLTLSIDGNNNALVYKYDALGRKTHMYWSQPFGTPLATWTYDNVAKGQVDRSIRFIQAQPYMVKVNGYNDRYQPTDVDVVIPSAETGLGGTYKTQYTYHVDGSPDSVAWTATADLPTEGLHYEYDPVLGLPMSLRATLGTSPTKYVTDTAYNALAQVEQLTLQTGSGADAVRLGYDRELETSRLTSSWVDLDTAPFVAADLRYDYDPAGNLTQIADVTQNPDDTQCFDYDHLRRLTEAWTPTSGDCAQTATTGGLGGPAPYWLSWTYDQVGNRRSQVDHQAAETTTYTYPPAGSPQPHTLTSATTGGQTVDWTYDVGGNTLTRPDGAGGEQTLAWDREGHLFTVTEDEGATTRYIYDADGNRLITRDPDGKTLYLPGQEVRWDAATDTLACTRYYDYHGQTIASRTADGLTWLASDYQGTAQVAITEQGQQVEMRRQTPFGTPRGAAPGWPNSLGFVGGYDDPTGLTHLGAREYDPIIGRFISVDPIMDPANPQQLQGYAYASNNPITYSDPTGLLAVCAPDGINFCPDQPVSKQPKVSGPPQRNWNNGPSCLEYCGSAEDNRLREIVGTPSNGKGGTTGPKEVGGATVTYDRAANALHGTNYGNLTPGQRAEVDYYVWERNNPETAKAFEELLAMLGEGEYTLFAELNGMADIDRCFSNGDVGSCVWTALNFTPGKALKALKIFKLFGKACSFSADTKVLMADGTTKPISEIEPGDQVLAADPQTGERSVQTVAATWVHDDWLVDLQLADTNSVGGGIERFSSGVTLGTVNTTTGHPFWNRTDQQWQAAEELTPGDRLLTVGDGRLVMVVGILTSNQHYAATYNLTTTATRTYFVLAGSTPVLVHNTGPACGPRFVAGSNGVFDLRPPFRQDTAHIFRDATGHLASDTLTNRAIIQSAVDPASLRSTSTLPDGSRLHRFFRTLPDGTQAWAEVRNGQITNGGLNLTPR